MLLYLCVMFLQFVMPFLYFPPVKSYAFVKLQMSYNYLITHSLLISVPELGDFWNLQLNRTRGAMY